MSAHRICRCRRKRCEGDNCRYADPGELQIQHHKYRRYACNACRHVDRVTSLFLRGGRAAATYYVRKLPGRIRMHRSQTYRSVDTARNERTQYNSNRSNSPGNHWCRYSKRRVAMRCQNQRLLRIVRTDVPYARTTYLHFGRMLVGVCCQAGPWSLRRPSKQGAFSQFQPIMRHAHACMHAEHARRRRYAKLRGVGPSERMND